MSRDGVVNAAGWVGTVGVVAVAMASAAAVGGVSPTAMWAAGVASCALVALCLSILVVRPRRIPAAVYPLIALAGLGFAQTVELSAPIHRIWRTASGSPVGDEVTRWVDDLRRAADTIDPGGEIDGAAGTPHAASVAVHRSRMVSAVHAIAVGLTLTAMVCVTTPRRRRFVGVSVVLGGVAMAVYGVVRTAADLPQPVPGIDVPALASSFGTFLYKNAGTAWLIPAAVLLMASAFGVRDSDAGPWWTEPSSLIRAAALMLLIAATAVAPSRGTLAAIGLAAGWVWFRSGGTTFPSARLASIRSMSDAKTLGTAAALGLASLAMLSACAPDGGVLDHFTQWRRRVLRNERWAHLPDTFATVGNHGWFGSGVGTYRFAAMESQDGPRETWFKHAHQQYLELIAEQGVAGAFLVGLAVWLTVRTLRRASRRDEAAGAVERRHWILVGGAMTAAAAFQAGFDLVLVVPAILFLYGLVWATSLVVAEETDPPTPRLVAIPAVGLLLALGVIGTLRLTRWRDDDRALRDTASVLRRGMTDPTALSDAELAAASATVAARLQSFEANPRLHRRMAGLETIAFRRSIADDDEVLFGETVPVGLTRPEVIRAYAARIPMPDREQLVSRLHSHESRRHAAAAVRHLAASLGRQPSDGPAVLATMRWFPIVPVPTQNLAVRTRRLTWNDRRVAYRAGFECIDAGEIDAAADIFHDYLRGGSENADRILAMMDGPMDAAGVCRRVIPDERPLMLAQFICPSGDGEWTQSTPPDRREDVPTWLFDEVRRRITDGNPIADDWTAGRRHAALAWLDESRHQWRSATTHWRRAARTTSDPWSRRMWFGRVDAINRRAVASVEPKSAVR